MLPPNKTFRRTLRVDFKAALLTTELRLLPQLTFYRGQGSISLDIGWLVFSLQFDFSIS